MLRSLISIFFIFVGICTSPANERLITQESPNKEFVFGLTNKSTKSEFFLSFKNNWIWSDSGELLEKLIAAWSEDSSYVLFVGEDRMSLKELYINGYTSATCVSINESNLLDYGASLIKYNSSIPNQGSIPHDLIVYIKRIKKNEYLGLYKRAKYPDVAIVKFKLYVEPDKDTSSSRYRFDIQGHLFQKWGEALPDISSSNFKQQ